MGTIGYMDRTTDRQMDRRIDGQMDKVVVVGGYKKKKALVYKVYCYCMKNTSLML